MAKRYPGGVIPFGELVFPYKIAERVKEEGLVDGNLKGSREPLYVDESRYIYYGQSVSETGSSSAIYSGYPSDEYRSTPVYVWLDHHPASWLQGPEHDVVHFIWLNKQGLSYGAAFPIGENVDGYGKEYTNSITIDAEVVFLGDFRPNMVEELSTAQSLSTEQITGADMALKYLTEDIPVLWKSPYVNQYLNTAFKINVDATGILDYVVNVIESELPNS